MLKTPLQPGGVAKLGLTGIAPTAMPKNAKQAVVPAAKAGDIVGVVWRDFKPGGGKPGVVESQELGLPGVKVELALECRQGRATRDDGRRRDARLPQGSGRDVSGAVGKGTFAKPFAGYSWLGPGLITPSLLIAYIWIWAGFAMVVIGAGLAAMPRDVLEAARTDGGTEWQVFRRVTVPLLAPVLSVVFITMIINVLKVFDIVLALAPESTQSNANVIALAMWRTAFGGVNDFGTGSAIAVFLFLLVIPVLALNIRRFKRDSDHGRRRRTVRSRSRTPSTAATILRWVAKAPVNLVLAVLGAALARADVRPLHHVDPAAVDARVERLVADLLEAEPRHLVELRRALPQPRSDHRPEDDRVHRGRQHADRRRDRRARRLRARLARVPRAATGCSSA